MNVTLGEHEHFPMHFSNEMIMEFKDHKGEMPDIMKIWHDEDGNVHGLHKGDMIFFSDDDNEMIHEFEIETNKDGEVIRKHVIIKVRVEDLEEEDKEQLDNPSFKIENSLQLEKLSFYPNPNNGSFNLSFVTEEQGGSYNFGN